MSDNIAILEELKELPIEVMVILSEEEKFCTFLSGLKCLFQITHNFKEALGIITRLDSKNSFDLESYHERIKGIENQVLQIKSDGSVL